MRLSAAYRIAGVVVAVTTFGVVLTTSPASAQVGCPAGTSVNCERAGSSSPGSPGSPDLPGAGAGSGPAGDPSAPIWRYFRGAANAASQSLLPPGTTQCYNTGLGGNMTLAEAIAAAGAQPDAPACPDLSGLNAIPGANGLPMSVQATIPPPTPQIRPGRNVTGLKAYLEAGLEAFPQTVRTGPFAVEFSLEPKEITVDWGDGSPVKPYVGPGVPYEERDGKSEITHVYERRGSEPCDDPTDGSTCYIVTVVETTWTWKATVRDSPVPEEIGLDFSGTHVDPRQGALRLPVEQVQAVRNR